MPLANKSVTKPVKVPDEVSSKPPSGDESPDDESQYDASSKPPSGDSDESDKISDDATGNPPVDIPDVPDKPKKLKKSKTKKPTVDGAPDGAPDAAPDGAPDDDVDDSESEEESEEEEEDCTPKEKPESEKKECEIEDSTIKARIDWFGPYDPEQDKCDTDLSVEYRKRLFKKPEKVSLIDRLVSILLLIPFPPPVKLAVKTAAHTALPIAQNAIKQVTENKDLLKKVGCLSNEDNVTNIMTGVANEQVTKTIEFAKEKIKSAEEIVEQYSPPGEKTPGEKSPCADKGDDKKSDKPEDKPEAKPEDKPETKGGQRMFFTDTECSFF